MFEIKTIQELSTLSLAEIKAEYNKLATVYARRMYERSKDTDTQLYNLLYGERLTAKKLEALYLESEKNEKIRYMMAYHSMAQQLGPEGYSAKQKTAKIKFAMKKYPKAKDATEALLRQKYDKEKAERINKALSDMGIENYSSMDTSDLIMSFIMLDPTDEWGISSLSAYEHTFSSEAEFTEWLRSKIQEITDVPFEEWVKTQ